MSEKRSKRPRRRAGLFLGAMILGVALMPAPAGATVMDYSANEAAFDAASAGLDRTLISFDSLTEGQQITNQFLAQNALFSTRPDKVITAETSGHGPAARSAPLCASVQYQEGVYSTFTIQFPQPVRGTSFYVLDVNFNRYVDVQVLDSASQQLAAYQVYRQGDYTHTAVLSDLNEIGYVVVTTSTDADGIAFDDVTVVVPEPATLSLLGLGGGLTLLRRRRA